MIAAHGWQGDWVRNISKEPKVRVLVDIAIRRALLCGSDDCR